MLGRAELRLKPPRPRVVDMGDAEGVEGAGGVEGVEGEW